MCWAGRHPKMRFAACPGSAMPGPSWNGEQAGTGQRSWGKTGRRSLADHRRILRAEVRCPIQSSGKSGAAWWYLGYIESRGPLSMLG